MCLSAATLICTVIVIRLHHRDSKRPLPKWTQKYILGSLAKRLGLSNKTATENNIGSNHNKEEDNPDHHSNDWIRLAGVIDRLFFVIYLVLVIVLTLGVLIACIAHGDYLKGRPLTGYGYYTEDYRASLENNV